MTDQNALDELEAATVELLQRGRTPLNTFAEVGRLALLLEAAHGIHLPPGVARDVVREIIERPGWEPMDDWQALPQDGLENGIDAWPETVQRQQRALALARYLERHAGEALAEEMVSAAARVLIRVTREAVQCSRQTVGLTHSA